jgi:nitrous oxide reductase
MDTGHNDSQPGSSGQGGSSRRKFLRQVGVTAAATAAFAGIADATGLGSAFAATKTTPTGPAGKTMTLVRALPAKDLPAGQAKKVQEIRARRAQELAGNVNPATVGEYYCYCTPGQCGSGCHPNGVWCHYCYNVFGYCIISAHYCIEGCSDAQPTCSY